MSKIGDFFVQIGVTADTFTVRDFTKAVGDIPFSVASAITSLGGLSLGFIELTKNTLDISNNLSMFRAQTGLSVDELGRWQAVATQVGVSGDIVAQSILGINNALAQLHQGNGAMLLPLGRMGVGYHGQDAFTLLKEIGAASQKMRPEDAASLMGQLGVNPQMMRLFNLSPDQFNKMASVGPVMSDSQLKVMQDFQAALGRFTMTIEKAFIPTLEKMEPYMEDLAKTISAVIVLLGKGAVLGLDQLHKARMARSAGIGWFSGDATSFFNDQKSPVAYSFVYGDTHFNINSTAHAELLARTINEERMRDETMKHSKAMKQFNNVGH